jgi:hypothetical protein
MPRDEPSLADLHSRLGLKHLNKTWAKIELFAGLTAAGLGLFAGDWAICRGDREGQWEVALGGLLLFVAGAYLALAGHRSHLYQSNNELTAYLAEKISRGTGKG